MVERGGQPITMRPRAHGASGRDDAYKLHWRAARFEPTSD